MDQLRVVGGVSLPTRRQARRAQRLNKAGRQALHTRYPHDDENCPIEAAWNATLYASDYTVCVVAVAFVWLVPIVLWLAAPHWHVSFGAGATDGLAWGAAAVCAAVLTVMFILMASEAARDRAAALACAAAGPAIDPWADAGL